MNWIHLVFLNFFTYQIEKNVLEKITSKNIQTETLHFFLSNFELQLQACISNKSNLNKKIPRLSTFKPGLDSRCGN
jgi:hypothetical protein